MLGFAALTIVFIIIGFAFHHLSGGGLLALYIVAQFFFNFGEQQCKERLRSTLLPELVADCYFRPERHNLHLPR